MNQESKVMEVDNFLSIDENIDIEEDYKEELDPEKVQIKIKEVGEMCEAAEAQQIVVNELAAKLKEEELKLKELLEVKIPQTLEAAGMQELKLTSGRKISISDEVAFSISETNRRQCMQWLRDHDYDSIIKNLVTIQFSKGEDKEANEIYHKLLASGKHATHKEDVHYQTMKAFLKEQISQNSLSTQDKELFKIYEYKIAKIK